MSQICTIVQLCSAWFERYVLSHKHSVMVEPSRQHFILHVLEFCVWLCARQNLRTFIVCECQVVSGLM